MKLTEGCKAPGNKFHYFLQKQLCKYKYSWFQAFALFRMLFVFFWVIPRRLIYICRRFGTFYLFHLQRQVWIDTRVWGKVNLYGRLSRMLAKHKIKSIALPPRKISNYLPQVKDAVGLKTPGIYSIPCECGKVYIGQSGRSIHLRINLLAPEFGI